MKKFLPPPHKKIVMILTVLTLFGWRGFFAAAEEASGSLKNAKNERNLFWNDISVTFSIAGKVVDQNDEPLIGVNIQVKGSTKGTATDFDGRFALDDIEEDAVLIISYIGYQTQEVAVAGRSDLTIVLAEDIKTLDEVVVVGYGTQKKANLTGAVDQVGSEVFDSRPMSNVTQGLQGVIPNLNISLADGKPNRSASYQIRGVSSIGQGGSALVLIDGVEGDPSMLNPNDIASVSVLKDASSAAIYGARGAFGVVPKIPKKDVLPSLTAVLWL